MTKYIAIIGLVLVGSLLFINKDKLFSQNTENLAQVLVDVRSVPPGSQYAYIPPCEREGLCHFCPKEQKYVKTNEDCNAGVDVVPTPTPVIKDRCQTEGLCKYCPSENIYVKIGQKCDYYKLNLQYVTTDIYGNVENRGKVTPAKPGKYAAGTTAVLTAQPIKGFKVLWDGPCQSKGNNVCKIKMNSDKNVTVDFVKKPGWKCSFSVITKSIECSKEW